MAQKVANFAIMFADIVGSTRLYEILGDQAAQSRIAETLKVMEDITIKHSGKVVKTIGDEVMCIFKTANDAVATAWEIHEMLENDITENPSGKDANIAVRVGMHFGAAIIEDGDVFGDAVNIAARMAAQAKGKQIIVTKETIDQLPESMHDSTRFVDHAPIKGKQGVIDIYEIIWQEDDVTHMVTSMGRQKKAENAKLQISYNNKNIELSKNRPTLVLGRSQNCDLPVNEKLASRQHVRIELRHGKFFIIDQSTNGTHVLISGSKEAFLRREEMPLAGKGSISLGRSFSAEAAPEQVVLFSLREAE